jgi:hypothetical protein
VDNRSARTDLVAFAQTLRTIYDRLVKPRLDALIRAQAGRIGTAAGRIGRDLEARLRDRSSPPR